MKLTLLILFLFTFAIHESESCSCAENHPQNNFCAVDIAILGTPVKKIDNAGFMQVAYKLENITFLKVNDEGKKALDDNLVYTPSNSGFCGVVLGLGHQYVMLGHVWSGKVDLSLCIYSNAWDSTSPHQQKGFLSEYQKHCSCKVEICNEESCMKKQSDGKSCRVFHRDLYCYKKGATCVQKDKLCKWEFEHDFCGHDNEIQQTVTD